jgi:DNA-binding CsgD family transcriptional regulator
MARFGLSRREAEVALLLVAGVGVKAAADRLAISPHTVRRHIENIYLKLDVHSRVEVSAIILGNRGEV